MYARGIYFQLHEDKEQRIIHVLDLGDGVPLINAVPLLQKQLNIKYDKNNNWKWITYNTDGDIYEHSAELIKHLDYNETHLYEPYTMISKERHEKLIAFYQKRFTF